MLKYDPASLVYSMWESKIIVGEELNLNVLDLIMRYTNHPKPGYTHLPFSIEDHEWQADIVNDLSESQDTMKCSQIGISEIFIRKGLCLSAFKGLNMAYVLPTKTMVNDYIPARFHPVIEASKRLRESCVRNVTSHMQFTNMANLYALYSTGKASTVATSLDGYLLDEFDKHPPSKIDMWPQRLGHSSHKLKINFSTPTAVEVGIHGRFLYTDQKFYTYKCEACGLWQTLDFPESIKFRKGLLGLPEFHMDMPQRVGINKNDMRDKYLEREPYIGCKKCDREINRKDVRLKQWVATYPNRQESGYSLSRLHVPYNEKTRQGHTASTIIRDFFEVTDLLEFYNQVLGLPFSASADHITDEDFLDARDSSETTDFLGFLDKANGRVYLGIDQGNQLHLSFIRIRGTRCELIHAQQLSLAKRKIGEDDLKSVVDEIEKLVRQYGVKFFVCDGAPDISLPRALVARMRHLGCYVFFSDSEKDYTIPNAAIHNWKIMCNRNWVFGSVVDMVKRTHDRHVLFLPKYAQGNPVFDELKSHFTSTVKQTVTEEKEATAGSLTKKKIIWAKKARRADHYLLATCYAYLAYNVHMRRAELSGEAPAVPLGVQVATLKAPL